MNAQRVTSIAVSAEGKSFIINEVTTNVDTPISLIVNRHESPK
jgi:hypothetical protein